MNVARVLSIATLCLTLAPAAALARMKTEPVENPTINLETKATPAQIKKGIKMAALNKQWQISNEKGDEFDATYTRENRREKLMAKIHVSW